MSWQLLYENCNLWRALSNNNKHSKYFCVNTVNKLGFESFDKAKQKVTL